MDAPAERGPTPRGWILWLVVAAAFLASVAAGLSDWSTTHDEGTTYMIALAPFDHEGGWGSTLAVEDAYRWTERAEGRGPLDVIGFLDRNGSEPHPPAFHALLNLWATLVGSGPISLRLLGVLFSLASLLGLARVGAELTGRPEGGVLAAALLALGPFFWEATLFLRPYALLIAVTVWSMAAALAAARHGRRRDWGALVALGIVGLYTHYHYAIVLAWLLTALVWARRGTLGLPRALGAAVLTGLAVTLGFAPWLPTIRVQSENSSAAFHYTSGDYDAERWFELFRIMFERLVVGEEPRIAMAFWVLVGLSAVALLARVRSLSLTPGARALWLTTPLLPLLTYGLDRATGLNSVLHTKYTCTWLPALVLGASLASLQLVPRALGRVLAGAWIALLALAAVDSHCGDGSLEPQQAFVDHVAALDRTTHLVAIPTTRVPLIRAAVVELREAGVERVRLAFGHPDDLDQLLATIDREQIDRVTYAHFVLARRPKSRIPPETLIDGAAARGWSVRVLPPDRLERAPPGRQVMVVASPMRGSYFR